MKSLQYSNDSQQSVKIGDTDTTIKLLFNKDNQVVDLTAASSINLKVADSQHAYIKTVSIDISDQSDLANGYLTIDLNDALISGLPSGTYFFEIWVNIDNETEIYPDSGFKSFVVKNNIEQGSSSYTTITLNDISAKLTETANTLQANVEQSIKDEIANGDFKGDKGDPGNTGNGISSIVIQYGVSSDVNTQPTSWSTIVPDYSADAPFYFVQTTFNLTDGTSYVSVQNSNFEDLVAKTTQIQSDVDTANANLTELIQLQNQNAIGKKIYTAYADDKVGTNFSVGEIGANLLTGTSGDWITNTGSGWGNGISFYKFNGPVSVGETYTLSVYIRNYTVPTIMEAFEFNSTTSRLKSYGWIATPADTSGTSRRVVMTFKVQSSLATGISMDVAYRDQQATSQSYQFCKPKLELGSVATPWIPNLADSNYLASFFKYKGIGMLNSASYSDYDWSQSDEFRDFKEQQLTNAILALGGTV